MPKVSVIIPIYNVAPYVERCLKSVVSQSFKDLEVIVVDDCGEDNSMALVQTFIDKYHGPISFRILRHSHNRGLSAARNTGIENATGEYVMFLDSDDYWAEDSLQLVIDKLSDEDILYFNAQVIEHGEEKPVSDLVNVHKVSGDDYYSLVIQHQQHFPFVCVWNGLFRRDFLSSNNLLFYESIYHEDELFTPIALHCAKTVSSIQTALYVYCVRDFTLSTQTTIKHCQDLEFIIGQLFNYFQDNQILDSKKKRYLSLLQTVVIRRAVENNFPRNAFFSFGQWMVFYKLQEDFYSRKAALIALFSFGDYLDYIDGKLPSSKRRRINRIFTALKPLIEYSSTNDLKNNQVCSRK